MELIEALNGDQIQTDYTHHWPFPRHVRHNGVVVDTLVYARAP